MSECICGSGLGKDTCCARWIAGTPAPTAEALMRSRYTAYTQGALAYIESTCAPEALAEFDRLDAERFIEKTKWDGLEILRVVDGGPDDETGVVEFRFRCTHDGVPFDQHEISSFVKKDGVWFYVNSEVNPRQAPLRVVHTGRNDPCPCGSNKKYKKCCGA